MQEPDVQGIVSKIDAIVQVYNSNVTSYMEEIRPLVRAQADVLKQDVTARLLSYNNTLAGVTNDVSYRLTLNLNRAYHKYDPGEIVLIIGLIQAIAKIISIVNLISQIMKVITGRDLVYWIDQLTPGFADAWHDLMENISAISASLGWGVDGLLHLTNIINAGVNMYGVMMGKDYDMLRLGWYQQSIKTMQGISKATKAWQQKPGLMVTGLMDQLALNNYQAESAYLTSVNDSITNLTTGFGEIADSMQTITQNFLEIQNDMPAFIAANIPQAVWDGITDVNDRLDNSIIPFLTKLNDSITDISAVLTAHSVKANDLADKIAHPGDMLMRINELDSYARKDQLSKIDDVTSQTMKDSNEARFLAMEPDLAEFAKISATLAASPTPLSFMSLELPGSSPGIIAEPRETWFVGDY
jgi:hypothetical protein